MIDPKVWSALDEAWGDAIRLPDGWRLIRLEKDGTRVEYQGGRSEWIAWWVATAQGPDDAEQHAVGTWPVTALFELAKTLVAANDAANPNGEPESERENAR